MTAIQITKIEQPINPPYQIPGILYIINVEPIPKDVTTLDDFLNWIKAEPHLATQILIALHGLFNLHDRPPPQP